MKQYGVDLSENNARTMSAPDAFEKLKASDYGDFIILRRGYGANEPEEDSCYKDFYNRAKAAGFDNICSYWFSYATSPEAAEREAKHYLRMTEEDGLALDTLILDFENNSLWERVGYKLSPQMAFDHCYAFLKVLHDAGLRNAVYASQWVLQDILDWRTLHEEFGTAVWNACYNPTDEIQAWMWQFSESLYLDDIGGPFDANVRY